MSLFIKGYKLLTENDLPFDRNLVLGTSQANTVNCDGGTGNTGLLYDVSSDFISAENNQVFSASVKVTADSDGGTFYFGITNPWQTIIYHNVEKGTHIYTWNNLTWTRNFNSQQEFTVDNHKGQVKFENLVIVKGNKAPEWYPAPEDYAMKSDLNTLQAQIDQLQNKIGGVISLPICYMRKALSHFASLEVA